MFRRTPTLAAAGIVMWSLVGVDGAQGQAGSAKLMSSDSAAGAQKQGLTGPLKGPGDRLLLGVGLTIVTTVLGEPQGDFESIKQVVAATPENIRFTYTGDRRDDGGERLQLQRTLSRADLQHARVINTRFYAGQPEAIPGATSFSVSVDVLNELKTKGVARIQHVVGEGGKDANYPIVLRAVESTAASYDTIVNNSVTRLAAIHAKSAQDDVEQVEFYILDDPDNPLVLSFQARIRGGPPFGVRVIKIESGSDDLVSRVCQETRVELYGVYFDFNRDAIRPESEPVLRSIADALTAKPACRLNIEGHTDNVGGTAFNLDLSKRRADAVKRALVERYRIATDRLGTLGYGLSRPKASNDTAEGRAQNRRVELVRP